MESTNQPRGWLSLRKQTVILFTIESLLVGMDYSLTFLTLWLYIKTLVKPENPTLCYSLVSAAFLAASLVLSGFVGRIVDRTRDVRKTFFIMNTVVIVGNLIYSIPISPWTLGIGRLLSGFGGPLRSVIAGELARCYHPDALSKVLSAMGMSYSFGFIIGPAVNFIFRDIDFHICGWQVTFVNMPGLYMAFLFFCVQVLSYFLVHDISKMYDLKEELCRNSFDHDRHHVTYKNDSNGTQENANFETNNETIPILTSESPPLDTKLTKSRFKYANGYVGENEVLRSEYHPNYGSSTGNFTNNSSVTIIMGNTKTNAYQHIDGQLDLITSPTPSTPAILKKLFSSFDPALLLFVAFFQSYFAVSFDMWIPMLVTDTMGWSASSLSWITIGIGVACVIPCVILTFVTISDRQMYIAAMGCILSLSIMESIFIILSDYHSNQVLDYLAWTIFSLLYAFLVVMEEVFLVGCLAKMVNSRIQTFADSIRLTMYRLGALIALLTSALIFQWIDIVGVMHIVVIIAGFTLMVIRRKTFMNPRIII